MKKEDLAGIFYTIVHDYEEFIVKEAIAEIMLCPNNTKDWNYFRQIQQIYRWSKKYGFSTIKERSMNMLVKIIGDSRYWKKIVECDKKIKEYKYLRETNIELWSLISEYTKLVMNKINFLLCIFLNLDYNIVVKLVKN